MSFYKFQEPKRRDYDTDEEYQEALDEYYASEDAYAERAMERRRERER